MLLNLSTGLVKEADYVPSPNHDQRPIDVEIDALVIHAISLPPEEFGGEFIEQLFTNCLNPNDHPYFQEICHLQVSAHFLIRRNGTLVQFVPCQYRAWHAGDSELAGRQVVNDFSIGIELEGCDTVSFEAVQYAQLAVLTSTLIQSYPAITKDRIVGHSDIAPGRKTDPGPCFDWQRFHTELAMVVATT